MMEAAGIVRKSEYSKIIESIFMSVYLWGVALGSYVVLLDPAQLDSLLTYIGAPSAIATAFYFWKARCENILKIQANIPDVKFSQVGDEVFPTTIIDPISTKTETESEEG